MASIFVNSSRRLEEELLWGFNQRLRRIAEEAQHGIFLGGNPQRFFCEMSVILKQLVVSSSFTCSNFFLNELILEFRGVTAPDTTHLQLVSLNLRKLSFWWFRKFPPTIGRQCFFVVVPLFQHDTWICFFSVIFLRILPWYTMKNHHLGEYFWLFPNTKQANLRIQLSRQGTDPKQTESQSFLGWWKSDPFNGYLVTSN